jgi:outer membrane receptor protein involved in Fe transport
VPRATIHLDGHYLNYNEMFFGATSVWDVESIEVYRGPQTTSQGANAIAGAIVVNTKDPSFRPEGAYQLEAGDYNSRRASIAVSGPVGEELAARLAVDYSGRDTFIDYHNPQFQRGQADQDFRALNARLKFLWLPSRIPGLEAKFTYSHNDSNRPSQEAASEPFGALQHWTTTMPSWKQKTDTGILDLSYELGNGVRLVNQAQYSRSSVQRYTGIPGEGDADIRQNNVSNEFRADQRPALPAGRGGAQRHFGTGPHRPRLHQNLLGAAAQAVTGLCRHAALDGGRPGQPRLQPGRGVAEPHQPAMGLFQEGIDLELRTVQPRQPAR